MRTERGDSGGPRFARRAVPVPAGPDSAGAPLVESALLEGLPDSARDVLVSIAAMTRKLDELACELDRLGYPVE